MFHRSRSLKMYKKILMLLAIGLAAVNGDRLAPGVPPQHYQQMPQQYQQHPQQQQYPQQTQQNQQQMNQQGHMHQQQQIQYQQVPVQQQAPVQVPAHQQVPQGHAGGHHAPHSHHGQQGVLNTGNIQHERDHIQEHMPVPIDTSKMSDSELQFHYFKMHDYDNNNKLDGCELIKSLIHWHDEEEGSKEGNIEKDKEDNNFPFYTDEKLIEAVDYILESLDRNKDGCLDYTEYKQQTTT